MLRYIIDACFASYIPGISVTAPIRRSTPFVPTVEMSTLFSFPSKNQINAQGAVTENPGSICPINVCANFEINRYKIDEF